MTKAIDALANSSVDAILKSISALALHPVTQFNGLEAMELVEALKNEGLMTLTLRRKHITILPTGLVGNWNYIIRNSFIGK